MTQRTGRPLAPLLCFEPRVGEALIVDQAHLGEPVERLGGGMVGHLLLGQRLLELVPGAVTHVEQPQSDLAGDRDRVCVGAPNGPRRLCPLPAAQNSTSPVTGSMPGGTSPAAPMPRCLRMRVSISSATSGFFLR